jgi:hypothetical protein
MLFYFYCRYNKRLLHCSIQYVILANGITTHVHGLWNGAERLFHWMICAEEFKPKQEE